MQHLIGIIKWLALYSVTAFVAWIYFLAARAVFLFIGDILQ